MSDRAPVQGSGNAFLPPGHPARSPDAKPPGTVAWGEHHEAWIGYAAKYGKGQSATRIAERGGFSYAELREFLGREPMTWKAADGGATRRTK